MSTDMAHDPSAGTSGCGAVSAEKYKYDCLVGAWLPAPCQAPVPQLMVGFRFAAVVIPNGKFTLKNEISTGVLLGLVTVHVIADTPIPV